MDGATGATHASLLAGRLDPVDGAMLVDEGDHFLNGRSSSAWAKYADALRRISFAWRSSRTSRSSALIRSCSSVVALALVALSLPAPQRLRRAADLRRDRADRRPLRGVLAFVIEHHPNRAFADFRGVLG